MCVIERDDKKTVGETLKQLRVNNKHHCCHQMETKLRMKRYIVMSLVFFADQKFNEHEFVIILCVCVQNSPTKHVIIRMSQRIYVYTL